MKQYFVYILKCSDNSYYTGITSDLEGRLVKHQSGYYPESYTHTRRPIELVFYTEFNDVEQARKKKEAIIKDNWNLLPKLSICKNETHSNNFEKDKIKKGFDSAQPDNP